MDGSAHKLIMLTPVDPVRTLPENYGEVHHLMLTDPARLTLLNLLSLGLVVPFFALMVVWTALARSLREPVAGLEGLPAILLWLAVLLVLPLHEWIHGVAIRRYGHQPRYGAKYAQIGRLRLPVILYATADHALFRRGEFIVVALAPMVIITLAGMLGVYLLPDDLHVYLSAAVIINGAGAIGDLWMTAAVLRYPPDILVRDEADGIRIFARR
jgi:hypothetical protein